MKRIIITLAIILCAGQAFGATYYVTQAGSGAADGTTYANSMSVATHNAGSFTGGDTIYLCDNITSQLIPPDNGTTGNVITYDGSYSGHPGIFRPSYSGIRFDSTKYLTFKNITFRDATNGMESYDGCQNATFENLTFTGQSLKGLHLISENSTSYVDTIHVTGCTFSNIGAWNETGSNSLTFGNYSRNTITEYCTFTGDSSARGVDGVLIENVNGDGSNHVIRYNTCSGLQENCIDLKHVVESGASEGNTHIYGNDLSDSNEIEIVAHHGTKDVHIYRNLIHDGVMGIGVVAHDGYDNSTGQLYVYDNLFYNISTVIMSDAYAAGSGGSVFVNNTCYNAGWVGVTSYAVKIATDNWTIKNNIFSDVSIATGYHGAVWIMADADNSTVDADYNLHDQYDGGSYAYRVGSSYFTVAQREAHGLIGDPLFVSTSDFRLSAGSPAIDSGVDLGTTYRTSLSGDQYRDAPWDIGCYTFRRPGTYGSSKNTAGMK